MAAGGTTATGQLIVRAQESTDQLKALLAEGGCAAAVDAILSDISESLSRALESLQVGASDDDDDRRLRATPEASLSAYGQGVASSGSRPVSRRSTGQRRRSYFRCARCPGCSAKKQVQQSNDDPSRLEITYIGVHACGDRPSPSCTAPTTNSVDDTHWNTATVHRATDVPSALQTMEEQLPPATDEMACTPLMGEEMAASWLFIIPSPAYSQSELLSAVAVVPELQRNAAPAPVDHTTAYVDEFLAVDDSVVPGS
uniref:WRKY domain-containing protein n=1 Tax=Oryza punctata TaxID=4537 RepID=A0A0E0LK85_ORYPU